MKKISFAVIILIMFLVIVLTFNKLNNKTDAMKFKEEYENLNNEYNEVLKKENLKVEIPEDNPIKYSTIEEIKDILKNKTGVIYFGFPECPWCRNAVPILLEAAKDMEIDTIYYYNAYSIRDKKSLDDNGKIIIEEEGTKDYQELIDIMYDKLPPYEGLNDESVKRLYFPTVVFVKNGKIIGLHTSTVDSQEDPYEKLTDEQEFELKKIYIDYMNDIYEVLCDEAC